MRRFLPHLLIALLFAGFRSVHAADASAKTLLEAVGPGMVRVEIDLQFDKGEPPTGVMDVDPGARQRAVHSLAELVADERPLETTGFLYEPGRVVAMDWTIHPRFIKTIHIRTSAGETTASVEGYGRDHWAVFLKLDGPLPGATSLAFKKGKGVGVASFYRLEGDMVRELLPMPSRVQQSADGRVSRVVEHQGVAVTANGSPVGILLNRRLPMDDSWQASPAQWPRLNRSDYDARLQSVGTLANAALLRTHLSFRSPKSTPGTPRNRFRPHDDDEDESATEQDVVGVALADNRVVVLAPLNPSTTARLQKIVLHPAQGAPIPARFVASLKDHGAFVVEPESTLPKPVRIVRRPMADSIERITFRVDLELQGETRVQHLHHARINAVRVGKRLEGFPELPDASDIDNAFLFTSDLELLALPIESRRKSEARPTMMALRSELTPARLIAAAVAGLPATGDPANIPVSEADENRVAWLGTELQPNTRELARANLVSEQTRDGETGAIVTYVHPGSPAAAAGLTPGAVLLRLRVPNEPVPIEVHLDEDMMRAQPFPWERLDELREQFFDRMPTPWAPVENRFTRALTDLGFGRKFTLEYMVDGKLLTHDFEVTPSPVHYESAPRWKSERLGMTVRDITYDVRRYTQRKADEPGVVISKLEPGGKASVAGVKPFEIVTHVNDEPVSDIKAFERLTRVPGELKLSIKRMAKGRIVTLRPE